MKLGILVVYLVAEEEAELFHLHRAQITRRTLVPYTIYAGAQRLLPDLRDELAQDPQVQLPTLVPTDLRGTAEYSFYLEQLARIAIQDGATHLVTLHTDSFPIRTGWAEELAGTLLPTRPLAALDFGPYTACLFFSREFYLAQKPRFMISEDERSAQLYARFSEEIPHINHAGAGYLYRAFSGGLTWFPLHETQKGSAFGSIYHDVIFHLHGSARLAPYANRSMPPAAARLILRLRAMLRAAVPKGVQRWAWRKFPALLARTFDSTVISYSKQQLLENPDAYLSFMRSGEK